MKKEKTLVMTGSRPFTAIRSFLAVLGIVIAIVCSMVLKTGTGVKAYQPKESVVMKISLSMPIAGTGYSKGITGL